MSGSQLAVRFIAGLSAARLYGLLKTIEQSRDIAKEQLPSGSAG
jgi:hypothetical protein